MTFAIAVFCGFIGMQAVYTNLIWLLVLKILDFIDIATGYGLDYGYRLCPQP
jgi:hypothetical protein